MVVVVEAKQTSWLERARAATARPLSRGAVEELARELRAADEPSAVDAAIDEALARAEGPAAAALLLAQAENGRRPDARRVAPVLPLLTDDLVVEALVTAATGDRIGMLLDVASGRLEANTAVFALFLVTALLDGAAPPPALLREARLLSREKLFEESGDMLVTVAQTAKDKVVLAVVQPWIEAMKEADAAPFDLVVQRKRLKGSPLAILPETEEPELGDGDGAPLQAEAKVGRNDPCPCGSGKKYKKCCEKAGAAVKATPASTARPAAEESPRTLGPREPKPEDLTAEGPLDPQIDTGLLGPRELLLVDPARCSTIDQLDDVYMGCLEWCLWDGAARAVEVLVQRARQEPAATVVAAREARARATPSAQPAEAGPSPAADESDGPPPPQSPDGWRMDLVLTALQAGESQVVLRQLERLDPALRETPGVRLLEALATPDAPGTLARLEDAAAAALRGDSPDCDPAAVALRVLLRHPALGTLLARAAALDPDEPERVSWLFDEIERARDRLLLPPGDDYQDVLDALLRDREARAKAAEAKAREKKSRKKGAVEGDAEADEATLRERLRVAATRASELEDEVKRLRVRGREEARGTRGRTPAQPIPADAAELARLREKVEKLEAVLVESQEERRGLRRQVQELEAARARDDEDRARAAEADLKRDEDDAEEGAGLEALDDRRPALVPVFSDGAAAAIREADRALGRAALRIVSGVAGGDPQVWGQVKRLRRRSDVCTARVGIHFRLLFRLHPSRGELEVVSFINRKELDATIRRLG